MGRTDRSAALAVAALSLALAVPYAAMGAGFILDDWWALRNAAFDGALAAGGHDQLLARPGAWLVYGLEFGLIGRHPLVIYVLQSALNAAVAAALLLLLRRFLPRPVALAAAAVWVVLPTHTSLGRWASTMNIVLSLLLLVVGLILLVEAVDRGRLPWGAAACVVASVLCYEATAPTAAVAGLAVPWLRGRRPRAPDLFLLWGGVAAACGWIVLHWHPAKEVGATADLGLVVPAHLGWGVAGHGTAGTVVGVLASLGIATCLGRLVLPGFRPATGAAERLVVAGVAVVVLGTIPFLRYLYAPIGAGDRVNAVAAVGGALAWTGLGLAAWRMRPLTLRVLTAAATATVLLLMVTTGVARDRLYARAAADVLVTLDALDRRFPSPEGPIAIGPRPLEEDNVVGLLDASVTSAAVQLHRGTRHVAAYVTLRERDFRRAPADRRLDQWGAVGRSGSGPG